MMGYRRPHKARCSGRREHGFSMIEVLVALVILALGLLGFALLQTMNMRFTQSANYRTQATNLAYDLLDQMRANRMQAFWYSGSTGASFNPGEVNCATFTRPIGNNATIQNNVERWRCQVVRALGPSASAGVTYVNGVVTVTIAWGDQRWDQTNPDATTTFQVRTRL
jgi:type IV pilus assembly protein PilV